MPRVYVVGAVDDLDRDDLIAGIEQTAFICGHALASPSPANPAVTSVQAVCWLLTNRKGSYEEILSPIFQEDVSSPVSISSATCHTDATAVPSASTMVLRRLLEGFRCSIFIMTGRHGQTTNARRWPRSRLVWL